ncbi:hypothetical protein EDC96DRAFT_346848 [Choanephora cucurbitarum]|nr:hypothetical protein EDC96DRAFT_346848 [Choanephora cucurbitarum]
MPEKYMNQQIEPSHVAIVHWLGLDQFVPEQFMTSNWVSTEVLFIIRLLNAIYSTIVFWVYFAVLTKAGRANTIFAAFTTLNFIGLHAYLITSTVHHVRYLHTRKLDFLLNQYAVLNYLYFLLYSVVATFNLSMVIIFWSMLANSNGVVYQVVLPPLIHWLNLSVHGASLLMIMIEVVLVRVRMSIRMVLPVFFIYVSYILLTFIIYGATKVWEYPFLDWSQGPIAVLWYFVITTVCFASFFTIMLVEHVRDQIAAFL